jgi:two-component system response regulator VanR
MQPYILVVDDDPNVAQMISDALESSGYRVTTCHDAKQALIQARSVKVGLMITDIMMPTYGTGLDAYRQIRQNAEYPTDLPVIFLTGLKPDAVKGHMPKNDTKVRLLHKPTSITNLIKTIEDLTGENLKNAGH